MMKRNILLLAAMILGVALAGGLGREEPAAAQAQTPEQQNAAAQTLPDQPSGPGASAGTPDSSRLLQKAEREGSVRAIVGLRTDFVPEGRLARAEVADQRNGIDSARSAVRADLAGTGYRTLREYDTVPYIALELTPQAFRAVQNSPRVTTIHEDVAVPADLAESAPVVQAPTMWANGFTGTGQTIAILDTGVDRTHPFFGGRVVEEACYSASSNCPNGMTTQTGAGSGVPCMYAASGCQHGTHVAGIAAGRGGDFSGVARGANIMAVQVFSRSTGMPCNNSGEDPCTLTRASDQIAGLERVYALRGTRTFAAVNMSLGGGMNTTNCDADPRKAIIDNLRAAGIATVISSGNDGFTNAVGAPACISSAITVGSTTKQDTISSFSDSSSLVDLLAPGDSINSSVPGGGFTSMSGTSMAAPHVAGAWAILEQWDAGQDVALILSRLQNMGTPVADTRPGGTVTARRINIADTAGVRPLNDGFGFWQGLGNTATFSIKGINGAATRESGEPDHLPVSSSLGENSVWYGWTAPASGQVTMNTCTSSFDTAIAVYTGGSTFSSLTQAARDDDSCTAPNNEKGSRLTFDVAAGTFYRIAVAGSSSQQEGTFTLGLAYASPSNDDLADAQLISGPSNSINSIIGANAGATREPGEPDHLPADSSLGEHSVWYDWTALRTGRVNVDTCSAFDTTFDTVLAVYTGGSFPSLTQVASNDDGACPNNTQSKLAFDATAGTNYRIAVSGFSASNGEGRFMLHVGDATPPNDNFADALSISGAPASTDGINVGATTEQGEPDHLPDSSSIGERSVWYNWTAPRTGRVNMDTCTSDFDTALAAYTGSSIGSLSQLASNDTRDPDSLQRVCDGPNIDGSRVSFDVVEGTTYRIAVSGFNFSQGTFTLKTAYAPLPNDNFADAQSVSGTSASTGGTNVGATREPGEPDHLPAGGSLGEHSVWYDWTAPRTGQVTMDTCTSNLDTVLAVYTGASVGSLNQVASDDDACTSPNNSGSRVSFDATAGITYRIAVSGFSLHSSQNTFTLGLDSALVKADYQLVNSRASSVGTAPALTDIGPGTNTFASATVDGTPTTVLTFPRENGVRLSPTTGVVQNSTYTIVALFELDEADRWRRILDFKNGVGDNGLYFDGGNKLNFFGAQSSGGTTVPANTWVQVALTRNTSGTVVGYVNGIQQFSFADSSNNAVIDANNALRFFKDNDTVGATAEESAGSVARIRLYDGALTANQVGALDRLDTTPPAVTKVTPANNATNIAPTANVTATFSESMRAGSINANTVKLKKAGTTATIPATVTYSASIRRAVLNPSANLVSGAKYIATVTTGAKDSAGNSLDQNLSLAGNQAKTWRFTVN